LIDFQKRSAHKELTSEVGMAIKELKAKKENMTPKANKYAKPISMTFQNENQKYKTINPNQ
jgi:hypothetical protein